MCGIAGILQPPGGRYNPEHTARMTAAIAHRGPDGEAFWQTDHRSVLFGHRRLSVIDLSAAAAQPMRRAFTDVGDLPSPLTIVYNGEIYNYIELKAELEKLGYRFHTASDTEVILAAYHCYGDACVEYFDGMFAFAIWDEETEELFAARDRFGEKPFFYTTDGDAFLFASEMKALWAAGIPKEHNLKMLFNFITIGYTGNPAQPGETFYTNIQKLPPASRLYYTPATQELVIDKYWDIDAEQQPVKIDEEDAIRQFSQLFNKSVSRRLRSDVPVGTSLSGGLDSSSIIAAITTGSALRPQTFTATFPGFDKDEEQQAALVAGRFGLQQHTVASTVEKMLADWDRICYHQEEPFGSASIAAQFNVFELAQQHQVKVLLDGQGADETLAGYHKYYKWYWQELFQKRKLVRSGEVKAARQLGITESFGFRNVIASLFPELAAVVLERQYLFHALEQEDLTRNFVKLQSKEAYYTTPEIFNLNGALYFNSCVYGLEELLRFADRNSMAHGREVRLPFLNHELVEFVFSLSSAVKIREGRTKWILRKTMDQQLPDSITWRKDKTGFEPPQARWMQNPLLQQKIKEARQVLADSDILKPVALQKPIRPAAAHDPDSFDWRYLSAGCFLHG